MEAFRDLRMQADSGERRVGDESDRKAARASPGRRRGTTVVGARGLLEGREVFSADGEYLALRGRAVADRHWRLGAGRVTLPRGRVPLPTGRPRE